MKVLWIILTVLAALLLLVVAFLMYGKATIRLICKNKLRLVLQVGPVPITLISDREKQPTELVRCFNPDRVLKKELRLQEKRRKNAQKNKRENARKAEKKARKKALAQGRPKPNLFDYGEMVLTLLRELYNKTSGRIDFRIRRLHIYLASGDAATTAMLYTAGMQALVYLIRWVETKFNYVEREADAARVIADFGSEKPHVDIDISAKMYISAALAVAIGMLRAYRRENKLAHSRSEFRELEKQYEKDGNAA